jgi:hypothetical protein
MTDEIIFSHSDQPEFYNPIQAESPAQRTLSEEFSKLEAWNRSIVDTFDPSSATREFRLVIRTPYTEIEESESTIAEAKRLNMLHNIGLDTFPVKEDDPRADFVYRYSNRTLESLWRFQRTDGLTIPAWISFKPDQEGDKIDVVRLMPAVQFVEEVKTKKLYIETFLINTKLLGRLGLTKEVIEQPSLTLDDKKAFERTLDEIQAQDQT